MTPMDKAIAAAVAAGIQLLANFGLNLSPEVVTFVNACVPPLSIVAVWAVPNKT